MLQDHLLLIIVLLLVVSLLSILGEKLHISYPIFLVISGLFIGFIPKTFALILEPNLVFTIFIPPLLFAAAWNTSWKDFLAFRRPVGLLGIGLVIFSSSAVALISHLLIPAFPLAFGFLLGAIISPSDSFAATSILQKLRMPRSIVTILEGESLINDAVSLIVFRFALFAVLTREFILWEAGIGFMTMVGAGIIVGLAIALLIYIIHRFLPTTASIDTAITLIAPYLMYITAEHYKFSGELAVVSGGLFLSARSTEVFSFSTRLQSQGVWETLVFLLNGAAYILIGLQLPVILSNLEPGTLIKTTYYGVIISFSIILIRIIWVFPVAYLPWLIRKKIRKTEPRPDWKTVLIIAWSGMRGVVSLAAALSIPLSMISGEAFPHRDLILFISFIVILCTLVLQGLTLPWLIQKLEITTKEQEWKQELEIKAALDSAVITHLNAHYAPEVETSKAFRILKERYEHQLKSQQSQLLKKHNRQPDILEYRKVLFELIDVKRKILLEISIENEYPEELIRNIEKEIDHEEAHLNVHFDTTIKEKNA